MVQSLGAMIQAGALSWLFSDIAMSGYMTGAAIEMFTSQLKGMFGLSLQKESEPLKVFKVLYTYIIEIEAKKFAILGLKFLQKLQINGHRLFYIFQTYKNFFQNIKNTNYVCVGISLTSIILLIVNDWYIKVTMLIVLTK